MQLSEETSPIVVRLSATEEDFNKIMMNTDDQWRSVQLFCFPRQYWGILVITHSDM